MPHRNVILYDASCVCSNAPAIKIMYKSGCSKTTRVGHAQQGCCGPSEMVAHKVPGGASAPVEHCQFYSANFTLYKLQLEKDLFQSTQVENN